MGVKCEILIQRTNDGAFRAGQPVVGTLRYIIDKPTKLRQIEIGLLGKGKCQWSIYHGRYTEYLGNKEEYVNICDYLPISQNVAPGTYQLPFEFFLPENIPTSMKNKFCTIRYIVFVTFLKDNFFGTKCKFEEEVIVYGSVSQCCPQPLLIDFQKKFLFSNKNIVHVEAEIERTFVTPGENIKLNLFIYNKSDVPVTIKTELVKKFTYVSDDKRKKVDKGSVATTARYSPTIREKSMLILKNYTVPTLPNLYSIQHAKILIGEYKVRVTAKVPFPHFNAEVEVPVVIGENKNSLGAAAGFFDTEATSS